jgi:hypothetical protein
MLRLCLLALFAVVAAGAARAEGTVCRSITDRDCSDGVARVTTKGNLRVEVFTRKRSVSFPLASAGEDAKEEFASSCTAGTCACDENVQYFEFKGPVPGFRQVNARERAAADAMKCSIDNSTVMRAAGMFSVEGGLVSTAVYELEYCRTCGGSCHGHTVLATYDGKTGATLLVRDAIRANAVEALRRHIVDYVLATYVDEAERAAVRVRLTTAVAERGFLDEGIYVEGGTAFINLDSFVLSCADSSFFPVPIPAALIAPNFFTRS